MKQADIPGTDLEGPDGDEKNSLSLCQEGHID